MTPSADFCKRLPKVEVGDKVVVWLKRQLHAHLTGSISRQCLQEIWEMRKSQDPEMDLISPNVALAKKDVGQSIDT